MEGSHIDRGDSGPGLPLTLDLQCRLAPLLSASRMALSEYGFANLYLFRDRHAYRFHEGPVPHIVGLTYDGVRHAMPLLPAAQWRWRELASLGECLFPVPEALIQDATDYGLTAQWNDADSDYVYDAPALSRLDGAKAKRAQARTFEDEQQPQIARLNAAMLPAAHNILDGWLADVGKAAEDTDYIICREALMLAQVLKLEGVIVTTASGEPVAFLLAVDGADGSKVVHFAKGRRVHSGAYPWMFARYAETCGAHRLNFEQDLGKPGFAQAKRALAPATRLRKYRLYKKDGR